ncbi:hypothetical protein V8C26DRAFT_404847 [Trichoderma gracile]
MILHPISTPMLSFIACIIPATSITEHASTKGTAVSQLIQTNPTPSHIRLEEDLSPHGHRNIVQARSFSTDSQRASTTDHNTWGRPLD